MTKRCFIALALPQEARWQIEGLISDLEKINEDKNIKFVDGKQAHATLHFLGNIVENQIGQIKEILAHQCAEYSATEIITGQISAFPDLKQPQTVYLDCREIGDTQLTRLQAAIGNELRARGFNVDDRKWQPHITLARIKGPCHFKTDFIELSELSISIDEVVLMESELNSDGPDHKIIASYKLLPNS